MPLDQQQQAALEAWKAQQGHAVVNEYQHDVDKIIEVGRAHFGNKTFDENSAIVAETAGGSEKVPDLMNVLRHFDRPADLIQHLAGNEDQAKQIARLSPERKAVALAGIAQQLGHTTAIGATPAYKRPETLSGRMSDEDWNQGGSDLLTDAQFHREADRRAAERAKRRR